MLWKVRSRAQAAGAERGLPFILDRAVGWCHTLSSGKEQNYY